ncbi:MAG: MTAP family purine nucleoside phosphorylase [Chthonomonas sp.]|nr:MTAP family purine nucleoside phosphorylase [Chthonomonas sp.]
MKTPDYMLIGGSGIGSRLEKLAGPRVAIPCEGGVIKGRMVTLGGKSVLAVQRHSGGHKTPPHLVNYAAFAKAAAQLGVKGVFATAAVGSLVPTWTPGTFVICSDFLDASCRQTTVFDRTVVHRDFTHPFDPSLRQALIDAAKRANEKVEERGVYMTLNGPRYETPAEIKMLQSWGAELVGMTASTEAIVMRECMVPYCCFAVVTNLAAGISETELDHSEVLDVMEARGGKVLQLIESAIAGLG